MQEKYRSRSCSSFTTGDCTERRDRTAAGRANGRATRRVLGRDSCGLPVRLGIEKAAGGGLHANARPSFTGPGAILHMSFRQLHELRREGKKKTKKIG